MAAIAVAAPVIPPTVVAVPAAGGAITSTLDVFLASNDPIVLAFPCLPWDQHAAAGGAPARASLPHFIFVRMFLPRNRVGTLPADILAARQVGPLTTVFTAAAWSQWLTELVASGLLADAPFHKRRDAERALDAIAIANPNQLFILAAHYAQAEPFDTPGVAGVPAVPGVVGVRAVAARAGRPRVVAVRARAAVPAVPAVPGNPGPADLAYLDMATLERMCLRGSASPLAAFCKLVGALGPCSTQAIRADVRSTVRITGLTLRNQIAKAGGHALPFAAGRANDAALAHALANSVLSAFDALSDVLALDLVTEIGLQEEIFDAFSFFQGTEAERDTVITRRLGFIDNRAPTLHQFIISTAANPPQARRQLLRFAQSTLRSELRDQPLLVILPDLEEAAVAHRDNFATAAAAVGANSQTIVSAVLKEHVAIEHGSLGSHRGDDQSPLNLGADTVTEDAYKRAFLAPRFRNFAVAMGGLTNATSLERRNIILQGFGSGTAVCAKQLFTGAVTLAKKHAVLGRLNDARGALPEYFGYVMAVDPVTGMVPSLLTEWKWNGPSGLNTAMMDQWLALEFPTLDWFNGPSGINALTAWRTNQKANIALSDPLDFFCTIQNVESLSTFGHSLFRGVGAADVLPMASGFTFKSWCEFYLDHIKKARELASLKEQISWLQDASVQFVLWLGEVAATVARFLQSSEPDTATLTALTTADCAPAEHLRRQQASKVTLDESRLAFSWMNASASSDSPPDPSNLPKLSDHAKLLAELSSSWPSTAKLIKVPAGYRPKRKHDKPDKKKGKDEADHGSKKPKPAAAAPGSESHVVTWLTATVLLFGKTVWDVGKICTDFNVEQSSRCWNVVCSSRFGKGRLALCGDHDHADHQDPNKGAHAPVPGFDPMDKATREKYARRATDAELAKSPSAAKANGNQSEQGRGRGRGRGGKSRGRGRGRSSFRGRA